MKKVLNVLVALVLVSLTTSTLFAQRSNQKRVQQTSSKNSLSQTETVSFSKIDAYSDGNGAFIKWSTEFELDNLGFDIYRIDGKESIKINPNLIPGSYFQIGANTSKGGEYSFFDPNGSLNSAYEIRNVSISGRNETSQAFYSKYEGNLVDVSGDSSENLQKAARDSNPAITRSNPDLPDELKSNVEASNSFTDINKQREIAALPGVKIGVKEQGVYRVAKADLQSAGFDTNADSSLWQLYLNGVEQSINVINNGDFIEFYGKGVDTIDTDTNVYFLVVGTVAGRRMGNTIRRGFGGNVVSNNFEVISEKRQRSIYFSSLLNGDEQNYFGSIVGSTTVSIPFDLDSLDFSTGKASVDIRLQGLTLAPHRVKVTINDVDLGELTGSNRASFTGSIGVPVSLLQNGTNTLKLVSLAGSSDISLFDNIKVSYKKLYQAKQNELHFYTRNIRVTQITGFTTQNIRVLDLTYPDSPTLVTSATVEPADKLGTSYTVSLNAHRRRNMYAFADAQIKAPVSLEENFPSTLSATNNAADMVIITPRMWLTQSNTYAAYRQNDGLNVKVVVLDDTYDEFAFGLRGHVGVKEFLRYAHNNWQTPPRYVLLMGDATNDPRNYTGSTDITFLPIKFIDTLYGETNSDEALADFNDDGLAELAVGRLPARSGQDITNSLTKVTGFEADIANAPARGSLCASDLPNGYDFAGLCDRIQNELPPSIPTMGVNRGESNAKAKVLAAINSGKYLVNYSGHGSTAAWENSTFFWRDDVPTLTNVDNMSIFLSLTCLNGYHIRPGVDGLSETLVRATNGGAVVVWSSTGETTPDVQEVMAKRFFNQIGNNPNMIRMGDLIRDAKSVLIGGRDVRLSWGLLGDPALRVKAEVVN